MVPFLICRITRNQLKLLDMAIKTINKFLKLFHKNSATLRLYSTKQPSKLCEMAFSPSPFDEIIYLLSFMHDFITIGQIYSVLRASKVDKCEEIKIQ